MPATSLERSAASGLRARWVAVVGLLALLTWFAHLGFFLYAAAVVGVMLAVSWIWATRSIEGFSASRTLRRSEVEIGETVPVLLRVTNGKRASVPWLYVEEQVEGGVADGPTCALRSFGPQETAVLSYRLTFDRRGLHRVGPAVMEATDPFGLVRRFRLGGPPDFVTVLPRGVSLTPRWPLGHRPIHEVPRRRSFAEDPSRFVGVREYRIGDELKRVHWRATARTGRLQSRVYEPAVLAGSLILLDVDERAYPGLRHEPGPARAHAEDELEHAVTVAVSIAEFVASEGQSVGLMANGADAAERHAGEWTGTVFRKLASALEAASTKRKITRRRPLEVPVGKGVRHGRVIRTALARLVPTTGLSLAEMIAHELPRIPRSVVAVIVTPLVTPELGLAIAMLKRCGLDATVLWLAAADADRGPLRVLPEGVPVHLVGDPASLARLGELSL